MKVKIIYLLVAIGGLIIIFGRAGVYYFAKRQNIFNPSAATQISPRPTPWASLDQTQSQSEANVTVSVKPLVLARGKQPKFKVSLETHSVNLDFDVASIADLTNSFGISLGPAVWEGTPAGGHHLNGILTFQKPLDTDVQGVSLQFRDIAGIPVRTFEEKVKL